MSIIDTPWQNMKAPHDGELNTLRIDHEQLNRWYWVRSSGGFYGVAIQLPLAEEEVTSTLQGTAKINIIRVNDSVGNHYLGVVINSSELSTVFFRLCTDLISACRYSVNPDEIISIIKKRVLSWQRLFEKGNRKLSPEQCLGLLAELRFLSENWVNDLSSNDVTGWTGPTGSSQDFINETKGLAVEVKTHAFDRSKVMISSKEQLKTFGRLYLVAYPGTLSSQADEGVTLNDYVEKVRDTIPQDQVAVFEDCLLSAGYIYDPFYSEFTFKLGEPVAYFVEGSFPRLTEDTLPQGIEKVKYDLDLSVTTEWICPLSDIHQNKG